MALQRLKDARRRDARAAASRWYTCRSVSAPPTLETRFRSTLRHFFRSGAERTPDRSAGFTAGTAERETMLTAAGALGHGPGRGERGEDTFPGDVTACTRNAGRASRSPADDRTFSRRLSLSLSWCRLHRLRRTERSGGGEKEESRSQRRGDAVNSGAGFLASFLPGICRWMVGAR